LANQQCDLPPLEAFAHSQTAIAGIMMDGIPIVYDRQWAYNARIAVRPGGTISRIPR